MSRHQTALRLDNNPLALVLAQVRIAPILAIEKYIPDIQEKFRKTEFPKFRLIKTQELELGPQVSVRENLRWIFTNKTDTLAISISQNSVTLESAQYEKFEAFSAQFKNALDMFKESTQAGLFERLGLRYVNLIKPSAGEKLDAYLKDGLHGIRAETLADTKFRIRFDSVGKTPVGRLLVKLAQHSDGKKLPQDLTNDGLIAKTVVNRGDDYAFLDIDHMSVDQGEFDTVKIIERLWALHKYTDLAFRAAVTPFALEKWK